MEQDVLLILVPQLGKPSCNNTKTSKDWLLNKPEGTIEHYCSSLYTFCEETGILPEEFQALDRLKARDAVWNYIKPFVGVKNSKAKIFSPH